MNYKERLVIVMKLKVGDVVEFKKYEDMSFDEIGYIGEEDFPKSGKIMRIKNDGFFTIEYCGYVFNPTSVVRVTRDVDINSLKPGDEVLVKTTVKKVFNGSLQINSSVDKTDVKKILKPERFIVQEHEYGMYIGTTRDLVSNKKAAQVYAGSDAAYQEATDMHLNAYDVIPYDD